MRLGFALLAAALIMVHVPDADAASSVVLEGNPSAPVKIQIYEDLQCGDCARLRTLLDSRVLPRYGSRIALIHRDFPLGKHEWARPAAIAARWVYEQNALLGISFRRELLAEQDSMTLRNLKPWLVEFATRNKLDSSGIVGALTDPRLASIVDQDQASGAARGVSRVPSVYIGGQSFVETILYEDLVRILDEALTR